ncbi:MAG: hypothetical protein AAB438_04055 [Patescibacteria group bacterium]
MKKLLPLLAIAVLFSTSFAFAQDGTSNTGTTTPVATTTSVNNMQCIQTAVATREAAVIAAWTTFSSATSTALSARATALNTAWGMTDAKARRTARNTAWSTYKTDAKKAGYDLKMAKRTAWEAFKTASKGCKTPVVESEPALGLSL